MRPAASGEGGRRGRAAKPTLSSTTRTIPRRHQHTPRVRVRTLLRRGWPRPLPPPACPTPARRRSRPRACHGTAEPHRPQGKNCVQTPPCLHGIWGRGRRTCVAASKDAECLISPSCPRETMAFGSSNGRLANLGIVASDNLPTVSDMETGPIDFVYPMADTAGPMARMRRWTATAEWLDSRQTSHDWLARLLPCMGAMTRRCSWYWPDAGDFT